MGPQMCVTALVASLNPAINPRQNSGSDSWEARPPYSQQSLWEPGTACQLVSLSWLAWCSPLHCAVGLAVGHPKLPVLAQAVLTLARPRHCTVARLHCRKHW